MNRREFVASLGAAAAGVVLPPLPDGAVRQPPGRRNVCEAGAVLAYGNVLECGVGPGHAASVVFRNDAVVSYLGLELEPETAERARRLIPRSKLGRFVVAEAEALDYLRGTTRSFDSILWDIDPLLDARNQIVGSGAIHAVPGLPVLLASRLTEGGHVITWQYGDSAPWDIGALRRTLNVTLETLDGHTCCIARYQDQ